MGKPSPPLGKNIKPMDGMPWILDQVPRGPGQRLPKNKAPANGAGGGNKAPRRVGVADPILPYLDTINEKPKAPYGGVGYGKGPAAVSSAYNNREAMTAEPAPMDVYATAGPSGSGEGGVEVSGKASIGSKSRLWSRWRKQ